MRNFSADSAPASIFRDRQSERTTEATASNDDRGFPLYGSKEASVRQFSKRTKLIVGAGLAIGAGFVIMGGSDSNSGSSPEAAKEQAIELTKFCVAQTKNQTKAFVLNLDEGRISASVSDLSPSDHANGVLYRGGIGTMIPFRNSGTSDDWKDTEVDFDWMMKGDVLAVTLSPDSRTSGRVMNWLRWFCEAHKGETFEQTYNNYLKAAAN
jgi:hypothetical protein